MNYLDVNPGVDGTVVSAGPGMWLSGNPVFPILAALLAGAAVLATVILGPRLIAAFEPYAGEPVRRDVPSRVTLGVVTYGAVCLVTWRLWEEPGLLPAYLFLTVIGVLLAAVDLRVHRLPDAIVLPSYLVLAALLPLDSVANRLACGSWDAGWPIAERAMGAATGAVIPLVLFGLLYVLPRSGMGLGDVKLAGLLGAALGWTVDLDRVLLAIVLGILSAGLWATFLLVTRRARRSDAIAYGPHLLLGALLALTLAGL